MGLQFSSSVKLPWLDAVRHCHDKGANLVEIFTEYQHEFVRELLDMLDDHEIPTKWWTGGNDIRQEGNWLWLVSFTTVGDFLWNPGDPNDGDSANCQYLSCNVGYTAGDAPCTDTWS